MKILLLITVVQALDMLGFAWFNRTAGLRILVLRQQLAIYKRTSKKPLPKTEIGCSGPCLLHHPEIHDQKASGINR